MLIGARFLCFPDGGCLITYYVQFGVVVVVQSVSVVVVYVATVLVNIYICIKWLTRGQRGRSRVPAVGYDTIRDVILMCARKPT